MRRAQGKHRLITDHSRRHADNHIRDQPWSSKCRHARWRLTLDHSAIETPKVDATIQLQMTDGGHSEATGTHGGWGVPFIFMQKQHHDPGPQGLGRACGIGRDSCYGRTKSYRVLNREVESSGGL